MPGRGLARLLPFVGALVLAVTTAPPATAAPEGTVLHAGGATAIPDSYIVVLNDAAVSPKGLAYTARSLTDRYGGTVSRTYRHALRGFQIRISKRMAERLAGDPLVRYVEQDHTVSILGSQKPTPSWGLDRIDQRALPLDQSYTYPGTASQVNAYIIDTGIRFTHQDFEGRAVSGIDTADDDADASDCSGHGTHVAGTVGGKSYGVAKEVTLIGVRVLNCRGSGSYANVIAGVDWVTGHHQPGEPAVANVSLGGKFNQAVNDAVAKSIADGISYSVAAGNGNSDACGVSPASVPDAITVGSLLDDDSRLNASNWGPCLDIFAPGGAITSAWWTSDTATASKWGTSMAAPHVAGAAALVQAAHPEFTPRQVRDAIVGDATLDVVKNPRGGSPNRLLHIDNSGPRPADFAIAASPAAGSTDPGGTLTATITTTATTGEPQAVTLSADGLPNGVTARFDPPVVTAGEPSTLTILTSATTPHGVQPFTVRGTGPSARHTAQYALTVNGPPPCRATNPTDVPVPDRTTAESPILIADCAGNASASSTVEVHVVHPWEREVIVTLIAPDGTGYPLHRRGEDNGTPDVDQTYTVNLSAETRNGTWRLRVQDAAWPDAGYINTWTLTV